MEKILGIVYAYDVKNAYRDVLDLGFSWVRLGVCFPWKDKMFGELCEDYLRCRAEIREAHEAGVQVMTATPGMGGYSYDPKKGKTYYQDAWPAFAGKKGSAEYYRNVSETCAFLCRDLGGAAGYLWQCMNEIDIPTFSGGYGPDITTGTARASAEGIVKANPQAKCGINLSGCYEGSLKIADMVYAPGHSFGYVGDDQYFGSWQAGTVENWNGVVETLHGRYGLPVLVNEWGYSSAGATVSNRPDPAELAAGIQDVCFRKAWFNEVPGGHTPQVQAEYLRRGLQIFSENPNVLGSFLFCYKDAMHCYHCGASDCPAECFWGIVDVNGKRKPAFETVKQAIREYYGKQNNG